MRRFALGVFAVAIINQVAPAATRQPRQPSTLPLLDAKLWANPPAEAPSNFAPKQLQGWLRELVPVVERIAGRKFRRLPALKLVSRKEFAAALTRDVIAEGSRNADSRAIDPAATARRLSIILAVRYVASDKTVYFPAGNIKPLFDLLKIPESRSEPLVKLMLIHTLAHALQDQYLDTNRMLAGAADESRRWTLKQLLEGHAVLIQRRAAAQLGLIAADRDVSRLIPAQAAPALLASLPAMQRDVLRHHHLAHGGAESAMAKHFRNGDAETLWALLRDPPKIVFQRPPVSSAASNAANPDNLLRGLDARFRQTWDTVEYAAGKADVALPQFRSLNVDAQRRIVATVRHTQTMVCKQTISATLPVTANVTLFVLGDPRAAATIVGFINAAQKSAIEQGPLGGLGKIQPANPRELNLSGGRRAYALRWSQAVGKKARLRQTLYWAIHERYVVQVLAVNFEPSDTSVATIIQTVLQRVADKDQAQASRKP